MIKCPNADCGYENVDGTQFCEGCGEELPQGAAATTTPAASTAATPSANADMIKCPACENLNSADNVVCEVCGTELHAGAATSSTGNSATPSAATPTSASVAPIASVVATTAPDLAAGGDLAASSTIASAVNGDSLSGTPLTASEDTTSALSPTGTTMPTGDAALTSPDAASAAVSGAVTNGAVTTSPAVSTDLQPGHVKLTVEQGMTIGKQFVLGDPEILVGREDDEEGIYPDVDLSDQDEGYVHRRHAQLKFDNGTLTVAHLGGVNRTRVNNKPLDDNTPQAVNIGDKIAFGKVVMRVGSV